ncbi:VanZ like protein [Sinobaca qinghaiensis]|uniref:VanZ like protein n=1 Tax=Sinobaca qinghaiensis TaxID=342944 RepID=A0A419V825_9BACL|nr:VanZ family protein [Sinobaca qinghaiensis]RKD76207.1 VanZ like protein [Sinobaca qinghaiensis]
MWNTKYIWGTAALGWCLIIAAATRMTFFTGSSTERMFTNPFLDAAVVNFFLRKSVHLAAFGLLAVLCWLALRGASLRFIKAWALAAGYGLVDEWHQSFMPERTALFTDVLINAAGAAAALLAVGLVLFVRRRQSKKRLFT